MPQASALRVLCVDDQESMLSLLKFAFAQLGIREVTLVASVRDAELFLKNGRFDLVVTDWNMPDIDGLTFFKRLKQDPDTKDMPVIMVTGHSTLRRINECRDAGVNEVLAKPVTARGVLSRIAEVIENPRAFVRTADYFGPDRRRRAEPGYQGPYRRANDNLPPPNAD